MDHYLIPAAPARAEILVINSRFIGSVDYTPSVESAKAFIAQVRDEMSDATHHAYAYLIGFGASVIAGMSDAGEPSGTAGRPMLAVLRGSGLGDITVVATRYFGGTLLGTGGLVRAYGDTTKAALAVVQHTERVELEALSVRITYGDYAAVRRTLEIYQATITDEDFAGDVTLMVSLPAAQRDVCVGALAEVTAGQAVIKS
ncbi:MAG: YigZ family protein [Chloroflexales bacterium]|nr:YigZ family protein [Chloroflexales bacterium]